MVGMRSVTQATQRPIPSAADALVDLDDIRLDDGEVSSEQDKKLLFAKSAEARRRIEDRLELKSMRDELGMDDFDL